MASTVDKLSQKIASQIKEHYISYISGLLDTEVERMTQVVKAIQAFDKLSAEEKAIHATVATYKARLHNLVDEAWSLPAEVSFAEQYGAFLKTLPSIFKSLEESKRLEQKKERFYSIESDSAYIKYLKLYKRIGFKFYRIPAVVSAILKRKKTEVRYWSHTVPNRNLAIRHFQAELVLELRKVTRHFFTDLNAQYLRIKNWEDALTDDSKSNIAGISFTSIRKSNKQFKDDLLEKIDLEITKILQGRTEAFLFEYDRAGTLEYSSRILTDAAVAKACESAYAKWGKNNKDWKNATYALFEEWRSDLDIYILKHKTLAELKEFQAAQIKKIAENIDPEINEIRKFIDDASESLSGKHESIQKELKRINYQANKKLDKELVPRLCEKLSGQDLTNLINKLEVSIRQNVEELSDEHVIVKSDNYDHPVRPDQLSRISPYELIAFETLTTFEEELKAIKMDLFAALERTTTASTDLDHIITFSFSSAIAAIEDEGKTEEEAVTVAQNGLKRAMNRLNDNRQALADSMQQNSERLEVVVNKFCDKIMDLTVNENVGELRLRITKAKAAKQAEEVRREVSEKIEERRKATLVAIKKGYNRIGIFFNAVGEKFILTASKPTLSKEVSDFLLESRLAIDKLPLIYRRLYQIEPLKDLELFEGRQKELVTFKAAFESWEQGRYATTAVLGEKWGGLTSFLNYAINEAKFPYSVQRFSSKVNISDQDHFIEMLRKMLKNEAITSLDQAVDHLNNGPKKIIILEDLQNLYLRKVNGFEALQCLFQLITRTNKNVFWVTSTTLYTWSYLLKTINIGEYFSYTIEMGNLTNEQIVNIIWKRNRISGFNIRFEPTKEQLADKKFNKLNDAQQQLRLKEEFFDGLNTFAKSNISLALIFWLLSTISVDDDTILIGRFYKPNLNFLTVLSMNKLYALHALILHDGLTEKHLSEVISISETASRLMLMALVEDGIIFRKGDAFVVNTIVYRDTISLLKSKNLIH